jgi:multiple sugar transport system ATP-binding protein
MTHSMIAARRAWPIWPGRTRQAQGWALQCTDPAGADRKAGTIAAIANRVGVTEPAGPDTFATMTLSGRDVVARMQADAAVTAGQMCDVAINRVKAVAFDPATEARSPS